MQGQYWENSIAHTRFATTTSRAVLLLPLAVTPTNSAVRRLGYLRWKQLHRLAYVAPFAWRASFHLES